MLRFSAESQRVIELAQDQARSAQSDCVNSDHILLALASLPEPSGASQLLEAFGASLPALAQKVRAHLRQSNFDDEVLKTSEIPFTPPAVHVLKAAALDAKDVEAKAVGTEFILLGLAEDSDSVVGPILREVFKDQSEVVRVLKRMHDEGSA